MIRIPMMLPHLSATDNERCLASPGFRKCLMVQYLCAVPCASQVCNLSVRVWNRAIRWAEHMRTSQRQHRIAIARRFGGGISNSCQHVGQALVSGGRAAHSWRAFGGGEMSGEAGSAGFTAQWSVDALRRHGKSLRGRKCMAIASCKNVCSTVQVEAGQW